MDFLKENTKKPTISEIIKEMQYFHWADYVVSAIVSLLYVAVGIYYYYVKSSGTTSDYLVGGRSMNPIPIAASLVATFFSGISMLGIPTEIYIYGTQFIFILGGMLLMTMLFQKFYLPILYDLKMTSVYEYLEKRFDWKIRLLGSVLFIIETFLWLSIVLYVPALAFNQATGLNISIILPVSCLVCIFYTSIGGLRAVVWTDVLQSGFTIIAILFIVIKGTIDIGGLDIVFKRNWEGDRIEKPNFDVNPLTRHTVWSLILGGSITWVKICGISQSMFQRYTSVSKFKHAVKALWISVLGTFIAVGLCVYCGLLIYATYQDCDPLSTNLIEKRDQLLILLVMKEIEKRPGFTGLFLTGVFGASLSSFSTGLNSTAAVFFEDFYKTFSKIKLSDKQARMFLKLSVVVSGCICLGFSYLVGSVNTIFQLNISVLSITIGPTMSLFTMGIFFPRINSRGALIGTITSLIIMSWIIVNAQIAIATEKVVFDTKPVSTSGCFYNFTVNPNLPSSSYVFPLYRISYQWYGLCGAMLSIVTATLVSLFTKRPKSERVKVELLAKFVRRYAVSTEMENSDVETNTKFLNNEQRN